MEEEENHSDAAMKMEQYRGRAGLLIFAVGSGLVAMGEFLC